jgi:hypothetical protein
MVAKKKAKGSKGTRAIRRVKSPRKHVNPRKHEVKADLANFELAKARSSLNLQIYANDEKIGELEIGRGSLYWYGRNRHRSKRIDWSQFASMMDGLAYGEKA